MSTEELIETAREIKEHCELSACKACSMFSVPNGKCILAEEFPCEWDLPEEEDCEVEDG
jgi:hypothetical protein